MALGPRVAAAVLVLAMLGTSRGQWVADGASKRVRSAPLPADSNPVTRTGPKAKLSGGSDAASQLAPSSAVDQTPHEGGKPDHFARLDSNKDGLLDRDEFKKVEPLVSKQSFQVAMEGVNNPAGFWEATGNSLVMIIATELGDKTFFLAAILSMRHSRSIVFIGAISALAIMHVLSVAIGFALPALLPRVYTHYAAVAMFAYFGVRLLWEARTAESDTVDGLKEAEEELSSDTPKPQPVADEESGGKGSAEPLRGSSGASSKPTAGTAAKMSAFAVLVTTFTLTFVAEWGDRSQIATIAMGAAKNPFGVMLGGVVGHALCTGLAVVGGKFLATKISERVVLLSGGALFVVFALHSLWVGP